VPDLVAELKKQGAEDVVVVVGGVIPPDDYDFLYKSGVSCIFGPGRPPSPTNQANPPKFIQVCEP
jgi:methylmalonyl-CoA mutase